MTTTALPSLPSTRAGASKVRGSELRSTDGFGEIDRKLSWLRNFLEMCEAGDDIVGSTPKSLALRADLKRQIADLENTRPTTAPVAPAHKCKPLSAQRAAGKLSSPNSELSGDTKGKA